MKKTASLITGDVVRPAVDTMFNTVPPLSFLTMESIAIFELRIDPFNNNTHVHMSVEVS